MCGQCVHGPGGTHAHRVEHGLRDDWHRCIDGQHLTDAKTAEPLLGGVVAGWHQPNDGDARDRQARERIAVETTQICGQQGRPRQPGRCGGDEISDVDAATNNMDAVTVAAERRDETGLARRVSDRGEERNAHGVSVAGCGAVPASVCGTLTRSIVPLSTAWTTATT